MTLTLDMNRRFNSPPYKEQSENKRPAILLRVTTGRLFIRGYAAFTFRERANYLLANEVSFVSVSSFSASGAITSTEEDAGAW